MKTTVKMANGWGDDSVRVETRQKPLEKTLRKHNRRKAVSAKERKRRGEMTDAQLADKLEMHNRWRRGELEEMPLKPKELGEVLDEVIRRLRQRSRKK